MMRESKEKKKKTAEEKRQRGKRKSRAGELWGASCYGAMAAGVESDSVSVSVSQVNRRVANAIIVFVTNFINFEITRDSY